MQNEIDLMMSLRHPNILLAMAWYMEVRDAREETTVPPRNTRTNHLFAFLVFWLSLTALCRCCVVLCFRRPTRSA